MNPSDLHFEKLTPIDNAKINTYAETLDFAFGNDDVKNIAITGSYGSGKSSVLESYKKARNLSFIHVSLAHFSVTDEEKSEPIVESSKKKENLLEGKILNQLLHQIPPDKIPLSHFKVKTKVSNAGTLRITVAIFAVILLGIYFHNFDWYSQQYEVFCLKYGLSVCVSTVFNYIVPLMGIFLSLYLLYSLVNVLRYSKYNFRKIALYGNEIEIFEKNEESFFDKYLNEVLYLFENAEVDTFVFEDMDRFDCNQIFVKLREINSLVNKKILGEKKQSSKIIRFFYLIRDDMFKSTDRTKFFDFIIPVVPVVDSSNSYDQFVEHFKSAEIPSLFDDDFLRGVSLYIDDMRLLKNICNEYIVYHCRIQKTIGLDCNKLLAIIIYKNLFPQDFSDSQLNRGFVYALFISKSDLIKNESNALKKDIEKNAKLVDDAKKEMLEDINELDALCLKTDHISVSGGDFTSHLEVVKALKAKKANASLRNHYGGSPHYDIEQALNKLEQDNTYLNRKEAIMHKSEEAKKKIHLNTSQLREKIAFLKEAKLADVLSRKNIDTYFRDIQLTNELGEYVKFESVKGSAYFSVLKYLIRNRYIDESYPDYMTYFYENSITKNDKNFLQNVADQKALNFSYGLKNPKLVVGNLRQVDFDQPETLNFDLFSYLLQNKSETHELLARFISQLERTKPMDFIAQYFARSQESGLFVEMLNRHWTDAWESISQSDYFTEEERHRFAIETLYHSSEDDIGRLNEDGGFADYISNNSNFLHVEEPNIEKIRSRLLLLGIRFKNINIDNANPDLFQAAYHADLYSLNKDMIWLILNKVYEIPVSDDYAHQNYSLIRSKPEEKLLKYVNSNIGVYFDCMMEWVNSKITDDEKTVLAILNNEDIDEQKKHSYIGCLHTTLASITEVKEKALWSALLECPAVEYSIDNILDYFFLSGNEMDETLVSFINKGSGSIQFNYDRIKEKFGENNSFYSTVVQCKLLSNQTYEKILRDLGKRFYEKFAFTDIPFDKIKILISLRIIRMNKETLEFMRPNYSENMKEFILTNFSDYVNVVTEANMFLHEELTLILDAHSASDDGKIKLLAFTQEPISILGRHFSDSLKVYLLQHNPCVDDLPVLAENYDTESSALQQEIVRLCREQLSTLISTKRSFAFGLLRVLFASNEVSDGNKALMLINSLPDLDADQAKKCFALLKMSDYVNLLKGKQSKLAKGSVADQILPILNGKGWITYKEKSTDTGILYQAIGKKQAEDNNAK